MGDDGTDQRESDSLSSTAFQGLLFDSRDLNGLWMGSANRFCTRKRGSWRFAL
jgi:hypothetical protein